MHDRSNNSFVPFQNIALTFSGGGFRAAAFSLGTLSYLDRVRLKNGERLLDHVKVISTVSGGTITGVSYATSLSDKETFSQFYDKLYSCLEGQKLLNSAMEILKGDPSKLVSYKRKSLINCFAQAYQEITVKKFSDLFPGNNLGLGHLEEVIFNSTDFNFALPFRFQNKGKFGNGNLTKKTSIVNEVKKNIFLSDVIAASACFPVGFEPIIFPDDFMSLDSPEAKELKKLKHFENGVGLMDGGIVDNQGVNSILLSQERRVKNPASNGEPLDLIIIADVASPYLEPWTRSVDEMSGWRNQAYSNYGWDIFNFIRDNISRNVYILAAVALALFSGGLFTDKPIWREGLLTLGTSLGTICGLLIFARKYGKQYLIKEAKEEVDNLIGKIPKTYRPLVNNFSGIRFGVLERMLKERASSMEIPPKLTTSFRGKVTTER